jgi:site-specific DNA-methyltransferase (adenine-specific)
MEYMKGLEDNAFDLAIVDPPYGIGDWTSGESVYTKKDGTKERVKNGKWRNVKWNDAIPNSKYFEEIDRVSKQSIIWGANYYNCFSVKGGAVIWDKGKCNPVYSRCEMASLSFQKRVDYVHIDWQAGFYREQFGVQIHPCQKPVKLYDWLLTNYSEPGQRILDTHLGSGSSAIAAHYFGVDFVGCEIDKDYYDAAVKRFDAETAQLDIFG